MPSPTTRPDRRVRAAGQALGTALVTGPTAGIGRAFAIALAERGHDLVLVARDAERLAALAERLRGGYGIAVEVLPADLADPGQLDAVAARVADPDRPVDLLVANAGFGFGVPVTESALDDELRLLDVLVRSVLVLTHAALPGMVARGRGAVVTVSSVAGFLPGGTYSAAKAWATTFTRSVAAAVAGRGVVATAVCPGFTRTEFHERGGLVTDGLPRWAWLDAERVAAQALRDVERGRALSVPSRRYRLLAAALTTAPASAVDAALRRLPSRPGRPPRRPGR